MHSWLLETLSDLLLPPSNLGAFTVFQFLRIEEEHTDNKEVKKKFQLRKDKGPKWKF